MSVIALRVEYLENDTIQIIATIREFPSAATPNIPGPLIDPDTHLIQIFDANRTLMQTVTDPVRDSVGLFHVFYTIGPGAEGTWRCDWQATYTSLPSKGRVTFPVIA